MRVEADYSDGFTERLLHWQLVATDNTARVDADWVDGGWMNRGVPSDRHRATFEISIDLTRIKDKLSRLERLDEEYDFPCTDLCTIELRVFIENKRYRWHLYGGEQLLSMHPKLDVFFHIWRRIDRAVERKLVRLIRRSNYTRR